MARSNQFVVPQTVYEIVTRTLDQRLRFVPTKKRTALIMYWLAKALKMHEGVKLHSAVFMGNHPHIIATDAKGEIAEFRCYLNGNLSRALNRLDRRRGASFEARSSATEIVGEGAELVAAVTQRIAYGMANPASANLVETYLEYPGLCAVALEEDVCFETKSPFKQRLFDEAVARAQANREAMPERRDFYERVTLRFEPFPGLNASAARAAIAQDEDAARARRNGAPVLGARALTRFDPLERPQNSKHSRRKPLCHAATHQRWLQFKEMQTARLKAYREASIAFLSGDLTAVFPEWTFKPVVRASPALP